MEMAYRVHAKVRAAIFGVPEDEIGVDDVLEWLAKYPEEIPECGTPYYERTCPICTRDVAQVNRKRSWSNVLALRTVLKEFWTIEKLKIYVTKKQFEDKPPSKDEERPGQLNLTHAPATLNLNLKINTSLNRCDIEVHYQYIHALD
ncbi:hypothetical protein NMY22_g20207 [Coprinellus aureogranulatus]|nr:hypothetical protein NMY22_g20207 [Coprinellus aureogranulatus]